MVRLSSQQVFLNTTLHLRPSHCPCLGLPQYSSLKYDDVITTTFVPPASAPAPYRTGLDRQQWYMFWADNFTRSEYVGFVDADTLFITYVDREGAWARPPPSNIHGFRALP